MSFFKGSKKNKTFDRNASLVETQLKLAFQAESENCSRLRNELAELQKEHRVLSKLKEREARKAARFEHEAEVLRKVLQNGPEAAKQVAAENEALRSENRQIQQQLKRMKKKKRRLKAELKKEREERANEKAMHEAQVKKLLEEKNHFEKKCYELQLQKLNQNFSEKTAAHIESEAREIFHKQLDLLPCHKDLPRLIRNMDVIDMEGNLISKPAPDLSVEANIRSALANLATKLDGEELGRKINEMYPQYVEEGGNKDLIKALFKFLKEVVGEQAKVTSVLKAANQSVIAPVVSYLQTGLEGVLPFNSAKNGWRIQILVGDKVIRVTHKRAEQGTPDSEEQYGAFTFDWTIDFILERELVEMKGMEVRLTNVTAQAGPKREKEIRDLLEKSFERFAPPKEEIIRIKVDN